MAVEGVPSSESRCISLRATSSPVWRLRPLKTCKSQYEGAQSVSWGTYSSICSLSKLLQLLEGAGMSAVVHGGHNGYRVAVGVAKVADADGRVGALGGDKCACVYWFETARGRS